MTVVRLYVDEDASESAVVAGLRARGVDLVTTVEANRCGASDAEQLEFATELGRVIYTFNAGDFARLHREYLQAGRPHAGIGVIRDLRYSIGQKSAAVGGIRPFLVGTVAKTAELPVFLPFAIPRPPSSNHLAVLESATDCRNRVHWCHRSGS